MLVEQFMEVDACCLIMAGQLGGRCMRRAIDTVPSMYLMYGRDVWDSNNC